MEDIEDRLKLGVKRLFSYLPEQSSLRKVLVRVLLDDLTLEEVGSLQLEGVAVSSVDRYRRDDVDLTLLRTKRRKVQETAEGTREIAKRRESAATWLKENCGKTRSGRILTVQKTELNFWSLFQKYQAEVEKPLSINLFGKVCKEHHVHFGVGIVSTMSCILCRKWGADIEKYEDKLLRKDLSDWQRKHAETKLGEVNSKLENHLFELVTQTRAWKRDLETLMHDVGLALVVLDYTTLDLFDRKKASMLGVVVLRGSPLGGVIRKYYDFVDVKLSGRKRDGLFFALTFLYRQGAFNGISRARIWSDSGANDFCNAPCIYSFTQVNVFCQDVFFESMNFFAARHGWSDCDRHFSNCKQQMSKWMMKQATKNRNLNLDVKTAAQIFVNRLSRTQAFVMTKVTPSGALHATLKGLTKNYSFRAERGCAKVLALQFSSSPENEGQIFDLSKGQLVRGDYAQREAVKRKAQRPILLETK